MGQKVHPLGFRLGITQKHQSYWCTNPRLSALWIDDASFLRRFIQKTYTDAGITNIEIHRRELDYSSITIKIYSSFYVFLISGGFSRCGQLHTIGFMGTDTIKA